MQFPIILHQSSKKEIGMAVMSKFLYRFAEWILKACMCLIISCKIATLAEERSGMLSILHVDGQRL